MAFPDFTTFTFGHQPTMSLEKNETDKRTGGVMVVKDENDTYQGSFTFTFNSLDMFATQPPTCKEQKLPLDGFPKECGRYEIACFYRPPYNNLFAKDPYVAEFGIHLTQIIEPEVKQEIDGSEQVLKKRHLLSAKAKLPGGPYIDLAELSTSTETWAATFPEFIKANTEDQSVPIPFKFSAEPLTFQSVGQTNSLVRIWKLPVQFRLQFSTSGEKNALRSYAQMFRNQTSCEVSFKFTGGEKIGAHIGILTIRSPVFAAMFKQNEEESSLKELEILDIKFNIFRELLCYIYSGQTFELLSESTVQDLFVAAEKYNIEDLKSECVNYMLPRIRKENAVSTFIWSDMHSVPCLKKASLECIVINGKDICKTTDWEKLTKNFPDLCILATRRMLEK